MPFPPALAGLLEWRLRRWILAPDTLVARLPLEAGFAVAEIGTGTGWYARAVAPYVRHVVGLDLQRAMLRRARRRNGDLRLVQAAAEALPLAPASLDLVFLVTVLGEVPRPHRALEAIAAVLRPGGWLAVSEHLPDPDFVPEKRLRAWCADAGFTHHHTVGRWWNYTARFTALGGAT